MARATKPKAGNYSSIAKVEAKSKKQQDYMDSITKNTITFGVGPAGTGKTFLAVYQAIHHLWHKKVNRIIISRPVMEAGEKLGYLPGDLNEKMSPYIQPLFDSMIDIIGFDEMKKKLDAGKIEIAPFAYMRGRTFNNCFVILDEAQNCTYDQLKMALTRLGHNTKCIVNGDPRQADLHNSGLQATIGALRSIDDVGVVRFTSQEVERSEIVKKLVDAFEVFEAERR
jgi:phosphate starvation-inducible PhoH-like protein